mgnify:FL=1
MSDKRYYKVFYSCSEYESQGDYESELKAIIPDKVSEKDGLEFLNTGLTVIGLIAICYGAYKIAS